MRGRRRRSTAGLASWGKIPARAGTTHDHHRPARRPTEDPRACGDDDGPVRLKDRREGRSPRVRGRRTRLATFGGATRKIPARAGTTITTSTGVGSVREDPRACGDDWTDLRPRRVTRGRSPRVRGRHVSVRMTHHEVGKIPARAGTTGRGWCLPGSDEEDPRACGDDGIGALLAPVGAGRSPRVRGRLR